MDILMPMGTFDALALTRRACSRGGSADSNIQIGNLHIREFSSFPSYLHHVHRSLLLTLTVVNFIMEKQVDEAYKNTADEVGPGASVPPELFPQIIRNVAKKDLLACSRVCRAWLGFAQPFIFRTLSLWLVSQCVRWNMKFDAYPRLLSMVEEVRLYGGKDYISMDPEASDGSESEVYAIFLMREPQVVRLLSRLTHIRFLSLHNIQLEPNQLLAFQNMTLVEVLDLSRVHFPSHRDACRFLEKMPKISALSIDFCVNWVGFMASDDPRNANSGSGPIRLKALTLCNVDVEVALLSWLLGSFFDLSGLHTLKIMWKMHWGDNDPPKPGTYALYEELISTCSHVKHLTLSVSHFVTPENPDFCLGESYRIHQCQSKIHVRPKIIL